MHKKGNLNNLFNTIHFLKLVLNQHMLVITKKKIKSKLIIVIYFYDRLFLIKKKS